MNKELRELLEEIAENKGSCGVCRKQLWVCDSNASSCAGKKLRVILEGKKKKA